MNFAWMSTLFECAYEVVYHNGESVIAKQKVFRAHFLLNQMYAVSKNM